MMIFFVGNNNSHSCKKKLVKVKNTIQKAKILKKTSKVEKYY